MYGKCILHYWYPSTFESNIYHCFQSLLKDVDALVYVDTDVVFLAPLEELWKHFSAMNSSHMAAMAPEHEDLATGWYNRFAKHPYYGRLGELSTIFFAKC